jgi:hypothetical protein
MTAVPGRTIISAALGGVATGFFLAVGRIAGRDPPDPAHPESTTMTSMDATTQARVRWFHLTPDAVSLGLLAAVGLLYAAGHLFRMGILLLLLAVAAVCLAVLLAAWRWFGALLGRRQFQFGIRALLVFTLACAIVCGWLSKTVRDTIARRKAWDAIEMAGGRGWYEDRESGAVGYLSDNDGPFLDLGDFITDIDFSRSQNARSSEVGRLPAANEILTVRDAFPPLM